MESKIELFNFISKNKKKDTINFEQEKRKIEKILHSYGINITCDGVENTLNYLILKINLQGKYKIKDILSLRSEILMNYKEKSDINICSIPNSNLLGIYLKNANKEQLQLGTLLNDIENDKNKIDFSIIIGQDINGEKCIVDLNSVPHMLISGTTGSGKTTLLDSFIIQMLVRFSSEELKMVFIDTRGINFPIYDRIPHLLIPTITNPMKALSVLEWVIIEMKRRYELFLATNSRDIDSYNQKNIEKIPRIIIVIDDFADIIDASIDNERLQELMKIISQESRAAGIHLIVSTYRPSTEVMKGIIKSNIQCRIALKTASDIDSIVVLNEGGAEKLDIGEAMIKNTGYEKAKFLELPFISNEDISSVIKYIETENCNDENSLKDYFNQIDKKIDYKETFDEEDPLLMEAIDAVVEVGFASASFIQRKFKIGYARSVKIIEQMEKRGIVSGYEGSKPRRVLITKEIGKNSNKEIEDFEFINEKGEWTDNDYNKDNKHLNIALIIVLIIGILVLIIGFLGQM